MTSQMKLSAKTASFLILITAAVLDAAPIPGKFYGYDVVAKNGQGGLTGMGNQPSINDFGQVAFIGQSGGGESIWVGDGVTAARNINPGSINPGRVIFGAGLQINNQNKIGAQDRLVAATPGSTLRVWDATLTDSFVNVARAGLGQPFDAVFGFASINDSGVAAAGALTGVQRLLIRGTAIPPAQFGITGPSPQPMIADDGRIVIRTGIFPNFQIVLFLANLGGFTTIANGPNFTSLDNAPGISDDGKIIAFKGDLSAAGATALGTTPGPGIFASIDEGGGTRKIVRITGRQVENVPAAGPDNDGECEPGETCMPAAEMGFDDSDNIITFASYAPDMRISVSHVDFGAPGIDDDTFRISFMATPSSASRSNFAAGGIPLLFSGQLGLWTIRVDVNQDLDTPRQRVYNPQTAIPVAQVGDRIDGATITSLGVGFSIGQAAKNEQSPATFRTMRRGDHRAVFWADTSAGNMIIRASHVDSDYDGLLDIWETAGIDMDQDGIADLNLAAMGAAAGKRDLFLQFDFLADAAGFKFELAPGVTAPLTGTATQSELEVMLRSAPALTGAKYGVRADGAPPADIVAEIVPHFDAGTGNDVVGVPFSRNLGSATPLGGNKFGMPGAPTVFPELLYFGKPGSVAITGLSARSFQEIKNNFFNLTEKKARELAFHYTIMGYFSNLARDVTTKQPFVGSVGASSGFNNAINVVEPLPLFGRGDWLKITSGTGAGQAPYFVMGTGIGLPQQIVISSPFSPMPDATSKFVILDGQSGIAEVDWYASPNNHPLPANDFIVSFGGFGVNSNGYLATPCDQWRTVAHELGHTLGLRHGGFDHNAFKGFLYLSLMSYSHQLECTPRSLVQSYSSILDPTFGDFQNLRMDFLNSQIHLGNSIGQGFGAGAPFDLIGSPSEQNIADRELLNGPIDLTAPAVSIAGPASFAVGAAANVQITASDANGVTSISASFDVNGNGVIDPTETVLPVLGLPGQYLASFGPVSGPAGVRQAKAVAADPSMNPGMGFANITIGTVAAPELTIALTGSAAGVIGQSANYQISVNNAGTGPATAVVVTVTLPAGAATVTGTTSQGTCAAGIPVICTLGSIANGAAATITLALTPSAVGSIPLNANVASTPADTNPGDNSAALTISVPAAADLAVALSTLGSAVTGQNLTFQAVVTNLGPSPAAGVAMTFNLPAGVPFVSSTGACSGPGPVVCNGGTLAVSGTATFQIVATPPSAGTINSSASVTAASADPNTANNSASLATTVGASATADLALALSTTGAVVAGQSLTYQLVVTNGGPAAATGVTATFNPPAGVAFVSSSPVGACTGTGPVVCTAGSLANSASTSFQIVVTPPAAGTVTSSASVIASPADPNAANNSVTLATPIGASASADLSVLLSTVGVAVAGQNFTYQMVATNGGPSAATGVALTFSPPAGVTFVSSSPAGACTGIGPVICTAANMVNAASATFQVVVAVPAAGTLSSSVSVTASTADPNAANNVASLATIASAAPTADLAVALSTVGSAIAGQNLTYQVTIANGGPSTATSATASFTLPGGTAFVSSSPAGACTGSGPVNCVAANLANGASATFQIVVTLVSAGNISASASVTGSLTDPNPANNSVVAPAFVIAPVVLTVVTPAHLSQVRVGETISIPFVAAGGTGPYLWTLETRLPAGLSFSHLGILSGKVDQPGPIYFAVSVKDSTHKTAYRHFALPVSPASVP